MTLREQGLSFPPEWAEHAATWMSWPRPDGISFPDRYEHVLPDLARIVAEIAKREPVHLCAGGRVDDCKAVLTEQFAKQHYNASLLDNITIHDIPINEPWCRDHGPAFLVGENQTTIVDFGFNAWGGKYPPWDDDDAVPTRAARFLGLPVIDARGFICEGGGVEFDGQGTILTTRSCLLNPNRNPGMTQAEIERNLLDYYGQDRVLWVDAGLEADDTDGHIDTLARFVDPRTIVVGVARDPDDPNHAATVDLLAQCKALTQPDGSPYRVVELPMPGKVTVDGEPVPATYMNFYFVNGAVLVPTYGTANDKVALNALSKLLPNREVVGVDCREVIWGLGAIHCLTQQQPR